MLFAKLLKLKSFCQNEDCLPCVGKVAAILQVLSVCAPANVLQCAVAQERFELNVLFEIAGRVQNGYR